MDPPALGKRSRQATADRSTVDNVAKKQKLGQRQNVSSLRVPADSTCSNAANFSVLVEEDEEGDPIVYDATLNQANVSANHNKFYVVQLLASRDRSHFTTYTRWGRVGEIGQDKLLGDGSLVSAKREFLNKFREKTGLQWGDRHGTPRNKKYTFLPKTYEDLLQGGQTDDGMNSTGTGPLQMPESKLPVSVQNLMGLIFNEGYLAQAMAELHYDPHKLPLGKLSAQTLREGFAVLQDLADLVQNPTIATNAGVTFHQGIEDLSNKYLTLIPHVVPRGSRPQPIDSDELIAREMELLENLSDMKLANDIMDDVKDNKKAENISPMDLQYNKLQLNEMIPLSKDAREFKELQLYLERSAGATHGIKYDIEDIFRIERTAEQNRCKVDFPSLTSSVKSDRRLLWHGSRVTNFAGILKEGLRIAPKEAPVSGYAFGKGIYLADQSTKSANYCYPHHSGDTGLLLLCEAELGKPMYRLSEGSADADKEAFEHGCISTWGAGRTAPKAWKDAKCVHKQLNGVSMPNVKDPPGDIGEDGLYLQYNEYICYNVKQVKLRYLFRVKMGY